MFFHWTVRSHRSMFSLMKTSLLLRRNALAASGCGPKGRKGFEGSTGPASFDRVSLLIPSTFTRTRTCLTSTSSNRGNEYRAPGW